MTRGMNTSARPVSCSNCSPLRNQARVTSLRPSTTGSNVVVGNTNGGMLALNDRRAEPSTMSCARIASSAARGLFRPMRSPYSPLGGRPTRVATTGGVAMKSSGNGVLRRAIKRDRMRRLEQGRTQNRQSGSIRSMLPWWIDKGSQKRGYEHRSSGDRRNRSSREPETIGEDNSRCPGARHALREDSKKAAGFLSCGPRDGSRPQSHEGRRASPCSGNPHDLSVWSDSYPSCSIPTLSGKSCPAIAPLSSANNLEPSPQQFSSTGLFEALTPQVPAVDLYILSDSLTFEAINKRGNAEALPVGRVAVEKLLGVGGKGGSDVPWVKLHEQRWDDMADDSALLLFPDEDINKASSRVDHRLSHAAGN